MLISRRGGLCRAAAWHRDAWRAGSPSDFRALPYANPTAPKGGRIVFGVQGTFDTLNSYSVRGIAAQGVSPPMGLVFQSLMARSWDEPFSLYGQIASSIETPDDRSWVQFKLDPRARFSDGSAVTSEDVLFTWDLLKTEGQSPVSEVGTPRL